MRVVVVGGGGGFVCVCVCARARVYESAKSWREVVVTSDAFSYRCLRNGL